MLNIYRVEKQIGMIEKKEQEEQKMLTWYQWKNKKEPKWLDNHQNRVSKFLHYVILYTKLKD